MGDQSLEPLFSLRDFQTQSQHILQHRPPLQNLVTLQIETHGEEQRQVLYCLPVFGTKKQSQQLQVSRFQRPQRNPLFRVQGKPHSPGSR